MPKILNTIRFLPKTARTHTSFSAATSVSLLALTIAFSSSAAHASSHGIFDAQTAFPAFGIAPLAGSAALNNAVDSASDNAADNLYAGPEILVTARHREERLQEVPIAISAVSGEELTSQQLNRISDYAAKIPNFNASASNPRVAAVNIRGLGGNASNDGAESGVGVIVDDVFFTHVGFSWLDFVDLESVQVVRGPQGTLLGKNTTIGAVIVTTAKPSFDPSLKLTATAANHGRFQIRANATGPIIDDKLAYRLTLAGDSGGGWIRNAYDGEKLLNVNRWSARGQLLFTPSSSVSNRIIGEYYTFSEYNNHTSLKGDLANNLYINDPSGLHADNSIFSARTATWSKAIGNVAPNYTPNFNGPHNANYDTLHPTRQKVGGLSNHLDIDFGGAKLSSITAYRTLWFRPRNDFDNSPFPILDLGYNVDVDQISQELRLASTGDGPIQWQLGAYYLNEKIKSELYQRFFENASQFYLGANANPDILNGLSYSKLGKVKINSGALFAQATWNLTDQFSITAGGRYTRETKKLDVEGRAFLEPYGVSDANLTPTERGTRNALITNFGGIFPNQSLKDTGNYWSWLVNPALKLTDDIMLYALASGGAKSGAANTSASPALIAAGKGIIKPEKSFDIEAGIKSSWFDRSLDINLNFYNNTITDYQAGQIDPAALALGPILGNVGKVRLRGVELETAWRPANGISFSINAAYNDAKYKSYDNAPAPTEYQEYLATIQGVSPRSTTLSLTGHQVINVPKWTANASANVDRPISNRLNGTAYVNVNYRSKAAQINPRSQFGWQEAFALVNAGIGLRSEEDGWSAILWSKNLFNKKYAIQQAGASAISGFSQFYGEPQTWGLTVSKTF